MGVPKFFMYMSERYPCLSELAREQCIPEFDNLYLDMNGIIHNCSHPDDNNFSFSLAEQDMFKDIFNYIDKLFFLIRPQKLFMLAVDGVAPRAKMNQQRSRRFRSAKEAEQLEEKAKQKGLKREDERFDSNCITPGTEFMQRLQTALRYFIKNKLSNDPLWQKCRIILSGHETPGEGEHKIMDYIRYMKSQPDYDPNTRHCLYGLDADLIILGLCTHELHFVVLREEVKFGKKTKHVSVEETRFFLLHLGLFREYLELEFNEIRLATGSLDIARLIDDWVLMSFLVGNDFVPHLPCLHISSNALPLLYKTYISIYPTLGGNINENGKLNLERLEKFFAALTDVEFEIFKDNHADLVYFDAKCSKNGVHEAFDFDVADINNTNPNDELAELIENSRKMMEGDDDEDLSDEEGHLNAEFETYKRDYYRTKLHKDSTQLEVRREQAVSYVTALQWILDYYYRGVQSWNWYYPYHYAPFISDLHDFSDCKIQFDMGKPFLPFEQLLAVLPAASKKLLPAAYHDLMTSEHSAIIEFYPQRFDTDLNGKKHEWEAVVLIPFIDEQLLLEAMRACEKNLTADEANRNKHGPMLQYDHTAEDQGQWPGVATLKPLYHVFCTEKTIWARDIAISTSRSWCVELPNASRTVFFPGFPTMKHLKFKFELKTSRVKVFDRPSRNNTMVLMPEIRQGYDNLFTVAEKHLNQTVYIGWPHLVKAKVVAISDAKKYIDSDGIKDHDDRTHKLLVRTAEEHLMNRMGIDVEDFSVMVHVKIFTGSILTFNTKGKATSMESWSPTTTAVPASILVSEIVVHKDGKEKPKKTEDILKADTKVFFLGQPHYASEGTIIDPKLVNECGRVQVSITSPPEPDFREARRTQRECESIYMNSYNTAAQLGLPNNCVSRITGSVLVIPGVRRRMQPENISKTNIGLQLRFPRFNEERIGYTRRINQNWLYSGKAIDLIMDYYDKFPQVFDALSRCSEENFFESDIFPNNVGENRLEEIAAWLKEQEYQKASVIACGSKTVEPETALKIFEAVEEMKKLPVRTLKLQVKPHLLLIPNLTHPDAYKSKSPVRLFDRVVIVKDTYMVPIGSKGTVVGIFPVSDPNPVRLECVSAVDYFYDILFDKDMPNGTDIHGVADQRVVKVPQASLLLVFTQQNGESASEAPHQKTGQTRAALPQEQSANENWRQPNNGNNNNNKNNGNANQRPQQNLSSNNNANNNNNSNNKQAVFENEKPSTSKNSAQVPAAGQVDIKTLLFEASKRAPLPPMPQFMTANGPGPGPKPASDDFWTPNANVVRKHAQPPQQQQQALQQQQQTTQRQAPPQPQQQQQAQQRLPRQPAAMPQFGPPIQTQIFGKRPFVPAGQGQAGNDETAMLKNMLGLSVNDGSSPNKSVQLPQPPQCWRSDAQRSQMRNANDVPQPMTVLPFGPPLIQPPMHAGMAYAYFGGKCVPLPAGQPMPLQMPQMMPPPGVPSHQPMPHQPMSPQAMPHPGLPQQQPMPPQPMPTGEQSFSPDSLVQKGAFIPLQAMRQPRSQGGNAPSSSASNHTKHDGPRPKDHGHHAQQQAPRQKPQRQQQTANAKEVPPQENAPRDSQPERPPAQKQQQPESTQSAAKKQVRTSKIGARFDNMP